jgi:hypothetical protein
VIDPGLGAGAIAADEHVCALYTQHEQRLDAMIPFVAEGLRTGSKCFAFVGDPSPAEFVNGLDVDLDAEGRITAGQLEVGGSDNTFFTPGEFDMDKLLTFWAERIDQGGADGYETVRLTADAAWWQPQFPRGEMSSRRTPAGG